MASALPSPGERGDRVRSARMVLVMANSCDAVARAFVERYARQGARLFQPSDLSRVGWKYELGECAGPPQAVVAGRACPHSRLAGVITRLASVTPADLPHINPADRAYVAVEMHAFLVAWLHALPCPVLNRPSPACLAGEWWSPQEWMYWACRLGIPVERRGWCVAREARMKAQRPVEDGRAPISITVVGSRTIGWAAPRVLQHAQRLAQTAGLDFVTVRFSSPEDDARFLDASLWPNLAERPIAVAALQYVTRQSLSIGGEAASA